MHERQILGLIATFVAVVEHGGFKRGAEAVGRSPSAVTTQINQLEQILNVRLLVRTTRKVRVTQAGEELLARGQRLLNEADRLVRDFRGQSASFAGNVELAVSPTIAVSLIPKVLDVMRLEQPDVKVSLKEALRTDMLSLVENGSVDFGIGPYSDVPETLRFEPMFEQEFRLILPERHQLARRGHARPEDLCDLDLLCPSVGSTARNVLEELAREGKFTVLPRYETMQYPTLYALVAGGLGVTVMPVVDPAFLTTSGLVAVPFRHRLVSRSIGAISRVGEELSPVSQVFIAVIRDNALKFKDYFFLSL